MNSNHNTNNRNPIKLRDTVLTALLIALVYVATSVIRFKLPFSPNGGLVHMGNTMLFTAALVFGARKGAAAGAFGMAMFDFFSEWAVWTPFTFVVRGVMGYIIGKVAYLNHKQGRNWAYNLLGIFLGSIWMLIGYYLSEVILYGNWIQPLSSIPGNILQIVIGTFISLPLSAALKKAKIS